MVIAAYKGGLIILTCHVKSRVSQYGHQILCSCKIIIKSIRALTLIDRCQAALKISEKPDEKRSEWGWQALVAGEFHF